MKCRIFPSLMLLATLSFPLPLAAQTRPGSSGSSRGTGRLDPNLQAPDLSRMMNVSGKVVLDNGAPLAEKALIESNCKGSTRTEAYTDAKGRFSIQFGVDNRDREFSGTGMASDSTRTINPGTGQQNGMDWRDCELKAVLAGFLSQVVDLRSHSSAFGHFDIGNIALHRVTAIAGGPTLSVKDAGIPEAAKKDFEKGLEEKKNGNLDVAQKQLHKAVEEYPKYAEAWLELGRAQNESKDAIGARQSFHRSIAADPNLMASYRELTQLAARDQQWQEVADTTDQMLKMNSESFPEFWFFNCVAKFYLGNLDGAEHSALQGIRTDTEHRIPKTEYILGVILLKKQDYPGATEHLRKYLSLDPNGPDVADANQKLAQIQHLAASSSNLNQ
jgi:Tfp pilus assembly protein PilF